MEILYIFGAVLVLIYIFRWDKLRNNEQISKSIDSVMKFIFLKPFKLIFVTIPKKIYLLFKWLCKSIDSCPRPLALFVSTAAIIITYIIFKNEIVNLFKPAGADSAVTQWIISIIIGAIPAFFIWKWRNYDKKKDQEHTERELNFKETSYFWEKFFEYQSIIETETSTENKKVTAIYALGNYYEKSGEFPNQVNAFFYNYLEKFRNEVEKHEHENGPFDPLYTPYRILALRNVINKHKKIIEEQELTPFDFQFLGEEENNAFDDEIFNLS